MALKLLLNPISGQFDYVNDDSTPPATEKFVDTFNATSDWTLNVDMYEIIIPSATHGMGANALIDVFEFSSGDYEQVNVRYVLNSSNDVVISVAGTPDLRFMGKVVIY